MKFRRSFEAIIEFFDDGREYFEDNTENICFVISYREMNKNSINWYFFWRKICETGAQSDFLAEMWKTLCNRFHWGFLLLLPKFLADKLISSETLSRIYFLITFWLKPVEYPTKHFIVCERVALKIKEFLCFTKPKLKTLNLMYITLFSCEWGLQVKQFLKHPLKKWTTLKNLNSTFSPWLPSVWEHDMLG